MHLNQLGRTHFSYNISGLVVPDARRQQTLPSHPDALPLLASLARNQKYCHLTKDNKLTVASPDKTTRRRGSAQLRSPDGGDGVDAESTFVTVRAVIEEGQRHRDSAESSSCLERFDEAG